MFLSSRNGTDIHLGDDAPCVNSSLLELTQGLGSSRLAYEHINDTGIFGRKTTTPLFFSSQISPVTGLSRPQKSLSSILAAGRGKSVCSPLTIDAITPANRAIGCAEGKIPMVQSKEPRFPSLIKNNKSSIGSKVAVLENEDCQMIELSEKSSLSVKIDHGSSAKRFKTTPNLEAGDASGIINIDVASGEGSQRMIANTQINLSSKISTATVDVSSDSDNNDADCSITHPIKHTYGELKQKNHGNKINFSKKEESREQHIISSGKGGTDGRINCEDDKKINASSFLRQVRAKLSDPEYNIFMKCMKGLKQKTMMMSNVLETVSNLFSAPERIFLLKRFGDFVPSQYQELYVKYLHTRCAEICSEGEEE